MRYWVRRSEYESLNRMLDDAIAGRFQESDYDESELSKLEVKWKRYLASSSLSAQKIETEKERIQELVTDISHQTRTPLANIKLYAQLLQEQPLDETSCGMAEEIVTYSNKLEFLIQSLVKTSRLESGVFQLAPKLHDLCELALQVRDAGEERARERNIRLSLRDEQEDMESTQEIAAPDPLEELSGKAHVTNKSHDAITACFDPKWTCEAIGNILDNAIKYSPSGAKVDIRVFSYEMFAGIEIADHGMGISETELPRIFARFYRGANVRDKEGVGVGLYLSRQIIEGQGGYIKVVSREGQGSRFLVYLPRR